MAGKSLESIHELLDEVTRGGDELGREEPLGKASHIQPSKVKPTHQPEASHERELSDAEAQAAEEQDDQAKQAEQAKQANQAEQDEKAKQAEQAKQAKQDEKAKQAEQDEKAKQAEQAKQAKQAAPERSWYELSAQAKQAAAGQQRGGNGVASAASAASVASAASAASGEEDAEENEAAAFYSPSLMMGFVERMKEHADEAEHQAAKSRRRASQTVGDAKQVWLDYAANNQACAEMYRRTQLREERNLETMGTAAVSLLPSEAEEAPVDDEAPAEGEAYANLVVANARITKLENRLTQYRATILTQNQMIRSYLESTTMPPAATPSEQDQQPLPTLPPVVLSDAPPPPKKVKKSDGGQTASTTPASATMPAPTPASTTMPAPTPAPAPTPFPAPAAPPAESAKKVAKKAATEAAAAAAAAAATVAVPAPKFAAPKAPAPAPAVPAPASTTKGTSSGRKRSAAAATDAVTPAARASSSTAPASLPSGAGPSSADLLMDQPQSTLGHEDCGGCSWPVKWDRALNECPDDPRHKCLNCGHLVHSSSYVCADAGAKYTSLIVDEGSFYCSVTCQLLGAP